MDPFQPVVQYLQLKFSGTGYGLAEYWIVRLVGPEKGLS
jgi:hypothetical protein